MKESQPSPFYKEMAASEWMISIAKDINSNGNQYWEPQRIRDWVWWGSNTMYFQVLKEEASRRTRNTLKW